MKCSSLLLISALSTLSAGQQINKTCNNPGQVALIIDTPTKSTTPQLLSRLNAGHISAMVAITKDLLAGEENIKLIKDAMQSGHEIGYRVNLDSKMLTEATENSLIADIKQAKLRIQEVYQTAIKFVTFPYTTDSKIEAMFAGAAEKTGLKPVGHSIYLGPGEEQAKINIADNMFDSSSKTFIALIQGDKVHDETLKKYKEQASKYGFQLVSMSQCLSGERVTKATSQASPTIAQVGEHNITKQHTARHVDKKSRKHRSKKQKGKPLVNPRFIRGYKGKDKPGKFDHKKKSKKTNTADIIADPLKPISVVKLHANVDKDFQAHEQKAIVANGVKAQDKAEDPKKDIKMQAGTDKEANSATSLFVGMTPVVAAAVMGLLTLL